ncbi:MAG: Hsp20 family protein, partial [Eggerthellaceae bacterium]
MTMMLVPARKNDFFADFLSDPFDAFGSRPQPKQAMPSMMKTDIKETEKAYEFDIDLPGFKKENVHAELQDGYLTIQASTESETEEKSENGTYLRKERFTG